MPRRKLRWVVAGWVLAMLTVGVFVLRPGLHRVTLGNYERIHRGMSRAEVYAILGPPGDYRSGPTDLNAEVLPLRTPHEVDHEVEDWEGDVGACILVFDHAGRAGASSFLPCDRSPQPGLHNLLWRAKRQWRHWFPR